MKKFLLGLFMAILPAMITVTVWASIERNVFQAGYPIRFTSTLAEAMDRLKKVIRGMKRATVIQETPDYLHVEFRTLLGFVDDAEFYVDESQKVIHLRSASRLGYWDLGVNRKRMEASGWGSRSNKQKSFGGDHFPLRFPGGSSLPWLSFFSVVSKRF
jgi:uncharacterized protein (DUF1499 family)